MSVSKKNFVLEKCPHLKLLRQLDYMTCMFSGCLWFSFKTTTEDTYFIMGLMSKTWKWATKSQNKCSLFC